MEKAREREREKGRERGGEIKRRERLKERSMGVPFKVKIESRLRTLRLRQFSKNITRRPGITARS